MMATKVYKVAVVGCPRAIISANANLGNSYEGAGKSCLCNRFVRPEAYTEDHQQDWSKISRDEWANNTVFNGDHFIYWGAANKRLPDKSTRVRFQVVEQTEFYEKPLARHETEGESSSEGSQSSDVAVSPEYEDRLIAHPSDRDYISRASATHFKSKPGKMAYRLKAMEAAVRKAQGLVRAATQLFPNEEFSGKKSMGIFGYVCVFDPTLEGDPMQRQLNFLSELLQALIKTKRKVVIACVKCDAVENQKIWFGSSLSSFAGLKKSIPFFEVSARDSVNVEEAFFALISTPKKNRNSIHHASSFTLLSYRESIDSRKGDLNRAKDSFQKFLQLSISDFSTSWSEALPRFQSETSYHTVKQLAGSEADEILLKLFQLRLIEIKLMEGSKLFGNSLANKADKAQSKKYQVYLKEAFNGHPDLRVESYKDYIPNLSESDSSVALTEPSTPSSYRGTPDIPELSNHISRMRSSTLSDLPDPSGAAMMATSVPGVSANDLNSLTINGIRDQKHYSLSTSPLPTNRDYVYPPPLPSRGAVAAAADVVPAAAAQQQGDQQPVRRRRSNSMDCLYQPEENDGGGGGGGGGSRNNGQDNPGYGRLNAEPYLNPMEVKLVLSQSGEKKSSSNLPKVSSSQRNNPGFLSMRAPKKGKHRDGMPSQSPDRGGRKFSSLERKGHKRSHSNPHVLESIHLSAAAQQPPDLPPRNVEVTPTHTPARRESICSPLESTLEFTSPDPLLRPVVKPLPPLPDDTPPIQTKIQESLKKKKDDGDNTSNSSGPFEEIDEDNRKKKTKDSPQHTAAGLNSSSCSDSDADNDQYAQIEDFQDPYMHMSSAPADKTKTFPFMPHSSEKNFANGSSSGAGTLKSSPKAQRAASMARKDSAVMSTLRKHWKKSQRNTSTSSEGQAQRPPPPPHHRHHSHTSAPNLGLPLSAATLGIPLSSSDPRQAISLVDTRPLPPSPIKGAKNVISRKLSSGSNIYEVIDEEFINRVRNQPKRQGSYKQMLAEWIPPVNFSLWPKYLEVVHKFFDSPQAKELWAETVRSVMENVDPSDVPPPYYNLSASELSLKMSAAAATRRERQIKEEEEEPVENRKAADGKKEEAEDYYRVPSSLAVVPAAADQEEAEKEYYQVPSSLAVVPAAADQEEEKEHYQVPSSLAVVPAAADQEEEEKEHYQVPSSLAVHGHEKEEYYQVPSSISISRAPRGSGPQPQPIRTLPPITHHHQLPSSGLLPARTSPTASPRTSPSVPLARASPASTAAVTTAMTRTSPATPARASPPTATTSRTNLSNSPTPARASPSARGTNLSNSPTPVRASPSARGTNLSNSPTPVRASPSARGTNLSSSPTPVRASPSARGTNLSNSPTPARASPSARGTNLSNNPTPARASPSARGTNLSNSPTPAHASPSAAMARTNSPSVSARTNSPSVSARTNSPSVSAHTNSPASAHTNSPSVSARTSSAGSRGSSLKQSTGSNELIFMLNQSQYNSDSSSETDSDEDFGSDSEFDSDLDVSLNLSHTSHEFTPSNLLKSVVATPKQNLPPKEEAPKDKPMFEDKVPEGKVPEGKVPEGKVPEGKVPEGKMPEDNKKVPEDIKVAEDKKPAKPTSTERKIAPKTKPKPVRLVSIPQTDLDSAMELRASESNESDLVSTDSALPRSPHSSNSVGGFEVVSAETEGGAVLSDDDQHRSTGGGGDGEAGVEVIHCVRPSQFLKRRATVRSLEERSRADSGTFEDAAVTTTTQQQQATGKFRNHST